MGHYTTYCHLRKNNKDEKHDPKAATAKIEEEFTMIAEIPPQGGGLIWSCSSKELQMGMILEESTSRINTLLQVLSSVVEEWAKCQLV